MKILIVDDNQDCLNDIHEALRPTGYSITTTLSPREALSMIEKNKYDVIITDVRMPEMTGLEFLKLITEMDQSIRVIAITAYQNLKTLLTFSNYHGYDFFTKPIQYSDLIKTLKDIEAEIFNQIDFKSVKLESKILTKMNKEIRRVFFDNEE